MPALASTIHFVAIDLPDAAGSDDRWLYRYTLYGFDGDAARGFSISFD